MMYIQDSSYSSDSNDSNFQIRGKPKSKPIKNANFEKNYPKNILTSIIAALHHKNYQQVLLDKGVSGKEIQRKNSASINTIHDILTHQLINTFNKHYFELLASNILLQNSKISKKAFHLLQIKEAFSFSSHVSLSQFRTKMSQMSKINSSKNYSHLQFFQYQSSTMYLLTLFCKAMGGLPNLIEEIMECRESTQEQLNFFLKFNLEADKQGKKNRDVLKPSIRQLSSKLNESFWEKDKFERIYDFLNESIINTEQKLIDNLNLKPGTPYLRLFCPEVVLKCFQTIEAGDKITISKLDNWVKDYETKSLDYISEQYVFDSSVVESQQQKRIKIKLPNKFSRKIKKEKRTKLFSPIVLTHPNRFAKKGS